jgi:CheY-like chemotaxis protein
VSTGSELLEVLAQVSLGLAECPDLIITDIHMPGIPGLSVVEELRAEHWLAPIIVISAFARRPGVAARIALLDSVCVVEKPFDPAALAALADALMV